MPMTLLRAVFVLALIISGGWTIRTMAQSTNRIDRMDQRIEKNTERALSLSIDIERRLSAIDKTQARLQMLFESIDARMNAAGAIMLLLASQAIIALGKGIVDWAKKVKT